MAGWQTMRVGVMARTSERAKLRTELAATRLELLQAKRVLTRIRDIGNGIKWGDLDHGACLANAQRLADSVIQPKCPECKRHL
jgi:hypothetical protein